MAYTFVNKGIYSKLYTPTGCRRLNLEGTTRTSGDDALNVYESYLIREDDRFPPLYVRSQFRVITNSGNKIVFLKEQASLNNVELTLIKQSDYIEMFLCYASGFVPKIIIHSEIFLMIL